MMAIAATAWGMQTAAWLLLVLYLATVTILLPRELTFLSRAPLALRGKFILQDVLLQVSFLMILIPCALYKQLGIIALTVVSTGFLLLWVASISAIIARQRYIHGILKAIDEESRKQIRELGLDLQQAEQIEETTDEDEHD